MILGHTLIIETASETLSTEGVKTRVWSTFKIIAANVQPVGFSPNKTYSFSLSGNELNAYFYRDPSITEEMRAIYQGQTYEIRAAVQWNIHSGILLVPIAGTP